MVRYSITPWKHPSDLLTVRQQLYRLNNGPDDQDLLRHAVDRIMAWKLRSNLPHAVESTALLIDAQLHHQNATSNTNSGPDISEFSIRAVYAAAFTRFVTGFCDIGRARERGLEQSSMLAIAKQIGMPAEFVALRHEATHEELPGLRRLLGAVEKGLEWLWQVYWGRLEEPGVEKEGREGDVRAEIVGLLKLFRRGRRDALRSLTNDGGELIERTTEQCISLFRNKREAAGPIAKVLVHERLLLPTNRSIGEPMDGAYMIWDDMLKQLDRQIPALLYTLTEQVSASITKVNETRPQSDTDKEAHALWIVHLAQTIAVNFKDEIMQHCCLRPGHWTQFIGQRVLQEGDEGLRATWRDIFEASLLSASTLEQNKMGVGMPAETQVMDVNMDAVPKGESKWTRAVMQPSLPLGVVR